MHLMMEIMQSLTLPVHFLCTPDLLFELREEYLTGLTNVAGVSGFREGQKE